MGHVGGVLIIGDTRIDSLHVSRRSDRYVGPEPQYGGVGVWKPTPGMEASPRCKVKPGYFHIKDTSGQLPSSTEGQCHGRVMKSMCRLEPSEVKAQGGVIAGFAIINGELKITSSSCNKGGSFSDGRRDLSKIEAEVARKLVEEWKRRGDVGFNMDVPAV